MTSQQAPLFNRHFSFDKLAKRDSLKVVTSEIDLSDDESDYEGCGSAQSAASTLIDEPPEVPNRLIAPPTSPKTQHTFSDSCLKPVKRVPTLTLEDAPISPVPVQKQRQVERPGIAADQAMFTAEAIVDEAANFDSAISRDLALFNPFPAAALDDIKNCVLEQRPILLVLLTSQLRYQNWRNRDTYNTTGSQDDMLLCQLDRLCGRITAIYQPGAVLHVVFDGLLFNDIVGSSDDEEYTYMQTLSAMTTSLGFPHIDFTHIADLLGYPFNLYKASRDEFIDQHVQWIRRELSRRSSVTGAEDRVLDDVQRRRKLLDTALTDTFGGHVKVEIKERMRVIDPRM